MRFRFASRRRTTPAEGEQRAIERIRADMAALGYDVSDLSDDAIRAGVLRFAEVVASSGITVQQAAQALAQLTASASQESQQQEES